MNEHKVNIVFVINSLEGGGAERVFSNLVTYAKLHWSDCNIKVILLDNQNEKYEIASDIDKYVLDAKGSFISSYKKLNTKLHELKPEIVMSFLTRSNCALLLCKGHYKKIISERVSTSSHFSKNIKGYIYQWLIKRLYKNADHIIAVSKGVKNDLVDNFNIPEDNLSVIYNSYDIAKIKSLSLIPNNIHFKNDYIVSAGRLVKNKNFAMLLEMYALAKVDYDLVILGDGPEEASLKKLTKALNIQYRVHFIGFHANPYPILAKAKAFISTSNAEGFPNALVEAMCLSLPVAATDCMSGPAEIIINKVNANAKKFIKGEWGFLLPVNNSSEGALALRGLLVKETLKFYANKSLDRASSFTVENAMEHYRSVTFNTLMTGNN